ncbi:MAG: CBS domain-containing protein [Trebonia sp.]
MTSVVDAFLARAAAEPIELTIRQLLGTWGYRARTYEIVARIQHDLSAAGLGCTPALNEGDGDSVVRVGIPAAASAGDVPDADGVINAEAEAEGQDTPLVLPPATLLVRHIPSAVCDVVSVRPNENLATAQSRMSAHEFSQLPVLAGPRDLKGAVSWRSIAQTRLSKSQITLEDVTRSAQVVSVDDELLGRIGIIYDADFVFVKGDDDRICGIVTTADLTEAFRDLTTPFFQLGEIERRLRRCIDRVFNPDELRAATGSKKLKSADGMDFGQYVRLLGDEARWRRMGWHEVDCTTFIAYLDAAREVRNRVMHFGEELQPADKLKLVQCLNFMRALDPFP